jgi:hypothetical protein
VSAIDLLRTGSRQSSQLVQHQGAGHRDIEGPANPHHGDLDNLIETAPDLGGESSVFMSEEDHDELDGWAKLLESNRVLVEFHADDVSSMTLLLFDPSDGWYRGSVTGADRYAHRRTGYGGSTSQDAAPGTIGQWGMGNGLRGVRGPSLTRDSA